MTLAEQLRDIARRLRQRDLDKGSAASVLVSIADQVQRLETERNALLTGNAHLEAREQARLSAKAAQPQCNHHRLTARCYECEPSPPRPHLDAIVSALDEKVRQEQARRPTVDESIYVPGAEAEE